MLTDTEQIVQYLLFQPLFSNIGNSIYINNSQLMISPFPHTKANNP